MSKTTGDVKSQAPDKSTGSGTQNVSQQNQNADQRQGGTRSQVPPQQQVQPSQQPAQPQAALSQMSPVGNVQGGQVTTFMAPQHFAFTGQNPGFPPQNRSGLSADQLNSSVDLVNCWQQILTWQDWEIMANK